VGEDVDGVIEVLTVISSERAAINLTEYPDISWPACGKYGYRKYNTVFTDEVSYHEGGGHAYKGYGVDSDGPGAVILIRPDQYVADILPFETCVSQLAEFFSLFMRETCL